MTFENLDEATVSQETAETARFFPPSSSRPSASMLPNPTPATNKGCGAGVGKTEGGKKLEGGEEGSSEMGLGNGFQEEIREVNQGKEEVDFINQDEVFEDQQRTETKANSNGNNNERKTATENNGGRRRKLKHLDIKILGLLEVWGALGLGQIEGVFRENGQDKERVTGLFFNEGFKYAGRFYLRLRELEKAGLVEVQRAVNSKQVYRLTAWGHSALRRRMAAELPSAPTSVSPSTLEHRIICAGTGLMISRFVGLPVLSERQFYYALRKNLGGRRPKGYHLPDLMVQLPDNGRGPVEVELHMKKEESYAEIWAFYGDGFEQKDRLLYLTPDWNFTNSLLDCARDHQAGFLYACDIGTFRQSLGKAEFRNFSEDVFRF